MRRKLLLFVAVFFAMFGAWSLGGELVDWWSGQSSAWLPIRLIGAAVFALIAIGFLREEKGG